jgi:hypothetical protein
MRRLRVGLGIGAQRGAGGLGGATVPAAFTVGQWTLADVPSPDGDTLTINISALPDDGGAAINELQFRNNGGTATAMTGTGTGARQITVTAETEADIEIRAVNAVGNGDWSDIKTATPTVSPAPTLTDLTYDSGTETASATSSADGTAWYFISNSATPLADGAAVKAAVQAMTPDIYGSFAITAGDNDEVIDISGLADGTWYLHAANENSLGVLADEDDVVSFVVSTASGWNLAGASYMSKSFNASTEDATPSGVYISPDGLKFYMTGATGDDLDQYTLGTAWDISTASHVRVNTTITGTQTTGVFFKDDGTKCYITQNSTDSVYEYTLGTAWDITSLTLNHTLDVSPTESAVHAIYFKPDGTEMYIVGQGSDGVEQYTLSTPWLLSSATHTRTFGIGGQDGASTGLHFKDDGSIMYMIGGNNTVYSYTLSTPWNISTASASTTFSTATETSNAQCVFFGDSGTKFYVADFASSIIYQYEAV